MPYANLIEYLLPALDICIGDFALKALKGCQDTTPFSRRAPEVDLEIFSGWLWVRLLFPKACRWSYRPTRASFIEAFSLRYSPVNTEVSK